MDATCARAANGPWEAPWKSQQQMINAQMRIFFVCFLFFSCVAALTWNSPREKAVPLVRLFSFLSVWRFMTGWTRACDELSLLGSAHGTAGKTKRTESTRATPAIGVRVRPTQQQQQRGRARLQAQHPPPPIPHLPLPTASASIDELPECSARIVSFVSIFFVVFFLQVDGLVLSACNLHRLTRAKALPPFNYKRRPFFWLIVCLQASVSCCINVLAVTFHHTSIQSANEVQAHTSSSRLLKRGCCTWPSSLFNKNVALLCRVCPAPPERRERTETLAQWWVWHLSGCDSIVFFFFPLIIRMEQRKRKVSCYILYCIFSVKYFSRVAKEPFVMFALSASYRLVYLSGFCLYKLDFFFFQPCAKTWLQNEKISLQRCWICDTDECFTGSTWSSWPQRSSGSRRNSCKFFFVVVVSFFPWWCFNHTNNSVGWDLSCFFFVFFNFSALSDSCFHPQGAQGPPGGVGSAGAVGEKVRGATLFENSTSKFLKTDLIENFVVVGFFFF